MMTTHSLTFFSKSSSKRATTWERMEWVSEWNEWAKRATTWERMEWVSVSERMEWVNKRSDYLRTNGMNEWMEWVNKRSDFARWVRKKSEWVGRHHLLTTEKNADKHTWLEPLEFSIICTSLDILSPKR